MNDDLIGLAPADTCLKPTLSPWSVLVVDDDPEVHAVTRLALGNAEFHGRGVTILSAYSAAEAAGILASAREIALILLDVVMESDQAGLELVTHIKQTLKNQQIRIVLRTGQPGLAPERDIVDRYPIDDYVSKTDLTFQRLRTIFSTALRSYSLLMQLELQKLELLEANEKLRILAHTDTLTGLLNRRLFDFSAERDWHTAQRSKSSISAIMMDVDYFKKYNDTLGHLAGDQVLKAVAQVLSQRCSRTNDLLCRFGGEEFLLVTTGGPLNSGIALAESIRTAVMALEIPHPNSPFGVVTLCAGVATMEPASGPQDLKLQNLLHAADMALYRAKTSGRNCVSD